MRTTPIQRMSTELLPCGTGFIRFGLYEGRPGYIMMDVMGFVNTAAKSSEVARILPGSSSFRCPVNGIPGRPNICLTLSGIEQVCKSQHLLTNDLVKFAEVEREKYPQSKEVITAILPKEEEVFTEIVSSIENKEMLIKLHKRMKRIENMVEVIYKELT